MLHDLFINVSSSEITIALLANRKLIELNKEKTSIQFNVGDIYLGKVKKIMPGLNAAFIDIGYDKDAFLHYHDLGPQFRSLQKYLRLGMTRKGKVLTIQKFKREPDIRKDGQIGQVLSAGQDVLVQIVKEPISTKGPRLSSEISIAGRNLVLLPFSDKVSVSQKIESPEERSRLKRLLLSIKPRNYGVIVRTVAENKKVAELDAELRSLVKKWQSAFEKMKNVSSPNLVLSELNRTSAILRDMLGVSFNSIHVNDPALYREIKEYISKIVPEKEKIVKLYNGKIPIFEKFGLEKQIKNLFGRTVSFKNGAYLIIEHTEALHVVDVNSGNRSKTAGNQETNALEVNMAAAEEIARQLRLRDMGGIIVVDFIDMQNNDHKQQVFDKVREHMSRDRARNSILPLSKFGLMQITRQRVRPETDIDVSETCPTCRGKGRITPSLHIVDEIQNKVREIAGEKKVKKLQIHMHPFIAAYLRQGVFSLRRKWQRAFNLKIRIVPRDAFTLMEYKFLDSQGEEIRNIPVQYQGS